MALIAGPFPPNAAFPATTGNVFGTLAGATIKDECLGVAGSIAADSTWVLRFDVGPLPSGTAKLLLKLRTSDTTHVAKVRVQWNVTNAAVDGLTFNQVTVDPTTISASGTAWDIVETKITLDGTSTMAADRALYVKLVFLTSGWTITAISAWSAFLIFE